MKRRIWTGVLALLLIATGLLTYFVLPTHQWAPPLPSTASSPSASDR